jgi:hypothetical protein
MAIPYSMLEGFCCKTRHTPIDTTQDTTQLPTAATAEATTDATQNTKKTRVPLYALIGKMKEKSSVAARCPWPFIFAHDPVAGLRDWQTWACTGLLLCWIMWTRK